MRSVSSSQPCFYSTTSAAAVAILLVLFTSHGSALTVPQTNNNINKDIFVITHAAGRMGKLLALQIHEDSKLSGTTPPKIRAIVRSDAEALSVQCDLGGMTMAGGNVKPIPLDWLDTIVVKDIDDEADRAKLNGAFRGAHASILCDASHNEIVWNDAEGETNGAGTGSSSSDSREDCSIIVPAAESRDLSERLLAEIDAASSAGSSLRHVVMRSSMGLAVGGEAGMAMGGDAALDGPRKAEAALRSTSLDYTILRLGALTDDPGMVPLMFGVDDSILSKRMDNGEGTRRPPIVSRADAARVSTFLLREADSFKGMTIDCSWHPKFGRNSVGTEEAIQAAGRQDLKRDILNKCAPVQEYVQ